MSEGHLTALDRLEVMDLIASYALCIDSGDVDGWVANFAPEGVLHGNSGDAKGPDQLRGWVTALMGKGVVGAHPPLLRHFVGLPKIEGDSQRCTAQTYCVVFDYDAERKVRISEVGRYEDVCVKLDGRWYFEHRRINHDLS